MSGTMWVLEFQASSIGQAQDVVRQHTPAGEMPPTVQEQGRLGYEVADADYLLISKVEEHIANQGGSTILTPTFGGKTEKNFTEITFGAKRLQQED